MSDLFLVLSRLMSTTYLRIKVYTGCGTPARKCLGYASLDLGHALPGTFTSPTTTPATMSPPVGISRERAFIGGMRSLPRLDRAFCTHDFQALKALSAAEGPAAAAAAPVFSPAGFSGSGFPRRERRCFESSEIWAGVALPLLSLCRPRSSSCPLITSMLPPVARRRRRSCDCACCCCCCSLRRRARP